MALANYQNLVEYAGSGDHVLSEILNKVQTDGFSFYRAVARHILGDPSLHQSIYDAVLTHYLRVIADDRNPYHDQYIHFDGLSIDVVKTFVGGLSCPDLCLGPQSPLHTAESILEVITNALDIKLVLHNPDMKFRLESGPVSYPEYHVKFSSLGQDGNQYRCSALTLSNNGRALINYLEQQQNGALPIRKILWWRNYDETGDYHCFNEYNPTTVVPDLSNNPDSLSVFTVFVKKPFQIPQALTLMDEALKRAPGQEIPLSQRQKHFPLKRYLAVDAEFKEVTVVENSGIKRCDSEAVQGREKISLEVKEHLCSVLTIAVDRHLVFSFYLLDMLQNPDADTVSNISLLFRRLILNKEYLKIWFNFQNDITVLDATIAHMFQGTLRNVYEKREWNSEKINLVRPSWKIDSGLYFGGERPNDLVFPRRSDCDLHDDSPSTQLDGHGHCCPCVRTSNIDITTIMDYLCIQFKYKDPLRGKPLEKRNWVSARRYCNYERFITWTMGSDRLFPLLNYFKSIPDRFGRRGDPERDAFYQSIGPGMEKSNDMMGYNIGDVAGVALLMRFLTTTDDRMLFLAGLANYSIDVAQPSSGRAIHQHPHQLPKPTPPPRSPKPYIYLNDYAKKWKKERVGKERLYYAEVDRVVTVTDIFQGESNAEAETKPYFEHEARARIGRECFEVAKPAGDLLGLSYQDVWDLSKKAAHKRLFDPLDYTLPKWFSRDAAPPTRQRKGRIPIIRSGITPYEDYLALREEKNTTEGFPHGFTPNANFSRDPARHEELVDLHSRLGKSAPVYLQRRPISPKPPSKPSFMNKNPWSEAFLSSDQRINLQEARIEVDDFEMQKRFDDEEGRMAEIRLDDIYDPYGRIYRRNWNRAVRDGWNYEERVPGSPPASPLGPIRPDGSAVAWDDKDAQAQKDFLKPVPPPAPAPIDDVMEDVRPTTEYDGKHWVGQGDEDLKWADTW